MLARRQLLLGALTLPLLTGAARLAAQNFAGTYAPEALPVADGIWLVRGADEPIEMGNGGAVANSVIIASDAGTIVIDPGPSLAFGTALAKLAQKVTGKAVTRIYITNLHPDRSFGAGAFTGSQFHALKSTAAELARDAQGFADGMYRLLGGWMAGTEPVMPGHVATGGLITFGGRALRLFDLAGHTGGDLALLDEATGTLIGGGLVFHNRAPATPHAALPVWQASLKVLEAAKHRQMLPGHGPLCRQGTAIAQTRDWLAWLETTLHEAVASGLDMAEAARLPIPDRFAGMAVARYELTRSVSHFYPRLEAELLPRIDG